MSAGMPHYWQLNRQGMIAATRKKQGGDPLKLKKEEVFDNKRQTEIQNQN
jgi:hypothetical protein